MSEADNMQKSENDHFNQRIQELDSQILIIKGENEYIIRNIKNAENDLSVEISKLDRINNETTLEEKTNREVKEDIEFMQADITKNNQEHNKLLTQLIELLETNKKLKEKLDKINSVDVPQIDNQQNLIIIEDNEKKYIS